MLESLPLTPSWNSKRVNWGIKRGRTITTTICTTAASIVVVTLPLVSDDKIQIHFVGWTMGLLRFALSPSCRHPPLSPSLSKGSVDLATDGFIRFTPFAFHFSAQSNHWIFISIAIFIFCRKKADNRIKFEIQKSGFAQFRDFHFFFFFLYFFLLTLEYFVTWFWVTKSVVLSS